MKKFLWQIVLFVALMFSSKTAYAEKIATFNISGKEYEVTTPYLNCTGKCDVVLKELKELQKIFQQDYNKFEKKDKVTYAEMFDNNPSMDAAIQKLDSVWIKIIQGAYNDEVLNEYAKTEKMLFKIQNDKFEKIFIGKNPNILNYPEAIEQKRNILRKVQKNVEQHLKQVEFLRSKILRY